MIGTDNATKSGSAPSRRGKTMLAGAGALVLVAIIAVVIVLVAKPKGSSNQVNTQSQEMGFVMNSMTPTQFSSSSEQFYGQLSYLSELYPASFSTMSVTQYGSKLYVICKVTASSLSALDTAVAKIGAGYTNGELASYKVGEFHEDASTMIIPTTEAPTTTAPTQAPTTPAPTTSAPFDPYFTLNINSGGNAASYNGNYYEPDLAVSAYAVGGGVWNKGTSGNAVWDNEKYFGNTNPDEGYHIKIANGNYEVTCEFVELFFTAEGQRIFQVYVEGVNLYGGNIDVFKLAGGKNLLFEATKQVKVIDGVLDIKFLKMTQNAKINGIRIKAVAV